MMPYALRQVPSFSSWYREKVSVKGGMPDPTPLAGANTPNFVKNKRMFLSLPA